MKHAQNFDAFAGDAVERQILSNNQVPDAGRDVSAGHAGIGMPRELLPALLDRIKHPVGCSRIIGGDVKPDCDQIFVRVIRTDDRQHDQPSRRVDSKRRRASAFTSAIVARELAPLSMPSCARPRSSSIV